MRVFYSLIEKIKNFKFHGLVIDDDSCEIIRGASTTLILKVSGLIFSYGFNILLARFYGAEVIGIYALSITVGSIFSLFAQLGTQTSLVRYIAQYSNKETFNTVGYIYKSTTKFILTLSVVFTAFFYFLSPYIGSKIFHESMLVIPLRIMAITLPFGVFMEINVASLRGIKKIKEAFIFSTVLPPIINIACLILLSVYVLKNQLTPIYSHFIAVLLGAVFSFVLWNRQWKRWHVERGLKKFKISIKEIIRTSFPMFLTSAMLLIMGMTDTIMLGIFRSASEVGIYRIVLKLAMFTSFTLTAVNSIAAPKFSELYWNGEMRKLKTSIKFSSKIILLTSLPIFFITVLFAKSLLLLFGSEFITGTITLIILSSAQFVNAACGSVGLVLDMTGKQRIFRNIMIGSAFLNIALNYLLIPVYGINGAALSTCVSTIVWNVIASIYVYKIYGYWVGYYPKSHNIY